MKNKPSTNTEKPLCIVRTLKTGILMYRDNFQTYYIEALKSYLWIFVPIYGWAKFLSIQAMCGRLTFQQMIEQPESISEAQLRIRPRLWSFCGTRKSFRNSAGGFQREF